MVVRSGMLAVILVGVLALGLPTPAHALLFQYNDGTAAASADFSLSGSTLTVVLTNTSVNDAMVPTDILTALFFSSDGVLAPVSATLTAGSTVWFGPDGGGNVGGEWAYGSGLSGAPEGATQGISSTGLGLFGNPNFGGADLVSPLSINGLGYGITTAGDNPTTGNTPVTGGTSSHSVPLIHNSVTFTLQASSGFTLASLHDVTFQYGTSLNEPHYRVPEPSTMLLIGVGVVMMGMLGIRKRIPVITT